jgi:HD-like signal output (HDOD) protein
MPHGADSPALQTGAVATLETELESRAIELPLLPNVAAEVLSSTLDDKSDATRLAELIQQDQGMATHIMRVVNSPAFRGSTEIVALQQAIARLGMERIREISLTISLKGTLFVSGPYDDYLDKSWNHGLRTGLWSKEVARCAKKNVEIAYLCGLLHNVGTPLVVNRLAALDASLDQDDLLAITTQYAPQAGIILVEEWHLPSAVGMTIRFKGEFDRAQNAADTVAIVDAASYLAELQVADSLDSANCLQHAAIQHLNLYPDDVERLCEQSDRIQATVEGMG